jgi:group I intron endonuclease
MSLNAAPLAVSPRLQNILRQHNLSPIAVWENLDQPGVKGIVKQAIRSLAGIYVIINLVNGDMYVGSAVTGRMYIRFHKHLYSTGSVKVAAAVRKYGLSNFAFIVIEVLEPADGVLDNKLLLSREQYYIDTLPTEYNIAPLAGNTAGVLHTEQTKADMRKNYSDERREMIGSLNPGKTLSPETIEAIRLASLNRSPMSDDTRALVSANSAKAQLYSLSRVDGTSFSSAGGEVVFSEVLRTLPVVAGVIGCGEKTVRRAMASNGIVKNTWQVTLLGKANNS